LYIKPSSCALKFCFFTVFFRSPFAAPPLLEDYAARLRLEIKNTEAVSGKKIKSAGIAGIIRPSKTTIQVIVGTKVQFVADEMKQILNS
jgi:hypothetical protein